MMLEYQWTQLLQAESHQKFPEWCYTITISLVGFAVGLFTFLNWKSIKDVKKRIENQFRELLDEKRKELDRHIETGRGELEGQVKGFKIEVDKQLVDLTALMRQQLGDLKKDTERDVEMVAEYAAIVGHASVTLSLPKPDDDLWSN